MSLIIRQQEIELTQILTFGLMEQSTDANEMLLHQDLLFVTLTTNHMEMTQLLQDIVTHHVINWEDKQLLVLIFVGLLLMLLMMLIFG